MAGDRLTDEQRAALDASLDESVETWDGRTIAWRELIQEDIESGRWGVLPPPEEDGDD